MALEDLHHRYGDTVALERLAIAVAPGEIVALIGPDGAGKTTTLRIAAGVLTPASGLIRMNGRDVTGGDDTARRSIGYLAQRFALYGDLTIWENLRFFASIYGVRPADREDTGARLLAMTDLAPFRDRLAEHLSGGMRQKLALACALIHRPRLLILDEPTAGVDPVSRRDLWRVIYRMRQEGVAALVATAYMDEAERFDRVVLLNRGRVAAAGTPRELRENFPFAVLEVGPREPRVAALRALRDEALGIPGVVGAHLFGDRLHIAADSSGVASALMARLAERVDLTTPTIVDPTVEDVFLAAAS
ncbi:MAG: ABC transporter ATP-binding protein [Chloroflexota bacterium]|nr:MAG: ABC transporter ATP-binding protein [Chloroflexota bacterium]